MAKYLINTTEIYRVENEEEAKRMIEEAKKDTHFMLKKYTSEFKERKQKGEVIDSYYKVTLSKAFTDERDPEIETNIVYNNEMESAF